MKLSQRSIGIALLGLCGLAALWAALALVGNSIATPSVSENIQSQEDDDWEKQRERMVRQQIEGRNITDKRVLDAMGAVPRHRFVPEEYRKYSYGDTPLPIGNGQTISQPYIVAYMTELAEVGPDDKVLEIGTGSGYQAAVLGELTPNVWSIEIDCELAERARKDLDELGYKQIVTKCGDGYAGWQEHAPFDAIIVTAAAPRIPQPLVDQLAVAGVMVIPVGEENSIQTLHLLRRSNTGIENKQLEWVRFVPMTGVVQKKEKK